MDPDRWARVKELFHAALEREPDGREAFLRDACAGDEALRAAVESLLARQSDARGSLESPAIEAAGVALAANLDRAGETRSVDAPARTDEARAGMIGATLLHYRIVDRLGAGGMGEVYAAEDTKLGRKVALKLLPPDMAADPERLQRFQREARAVAALNHPNIVTIYTVEEADGVQFLTMELVEGKTLSEVIPAGGLPLEEVLRLAGPLVDAVAYAHEHGIVHRDLKPANIMLAEGGRLKVLDFGLAKLKPALSATDTTRLQTASLTQHHAVVGTAAYMSPEQAEGQPVDHRSDIFSLGVVLYEMACGKRPFKGDSFFSMISSLLKDTPQPLSAVNRAVPPALDRILARALAKDPAERYQLARELGAELQQVREQAASVRMVTNLIRAVAGSDWTRRLALVALVAAATAAGWALVPWRNWFGRQSAPAVPAFQHTRLSSVPGVEQFPSLLPDGKWMVYAGQQTGNLDIYFVSTSSPDANPTNLTHDPADDDEPAVSRDGERIVFRSSRDGGGIFVMGRGGERVRRVTPANITAAFNPTWSPDGTEIAYATENVQSKPLNWERRSELWIVNEATNEVRKIETDDAVQPSWSPNGHRIAYVSRPWQGKTGSGPGQRGMDIWTVRPRDGDPVPLTSDDWTDWSPVWSPDGRYVYFASDRGGSMNLWRVAVDEESGRVQGEPQSIILPAPFLAHPTISGDGRRIAYSAVSETTNIQHRTLDPATGTIGSQAQANWVTSGSRLWANPDPTFDGEWVAYYSQDQPLGDVYVCRPDGSERRPLTSDAANDRVPRWSPDRTWVAFFAGPDRGGTQAPLGLWKVHHDGSGLQRVSDMGTIPVWSPTGDRIATSEQIDAQGRSRTFVFDPNRLWNAQTPEELPQPEEALRPFIAQDWSQDDTRLAGQIGFSAPPSRGGGIVVYTFASRAYERLTSFGEWPVWLPDGRRVLFVAGGREFWIVDTRTKETQKIESTVWDVLGPPRLTRDGRNLYYSRGVKEADIHLITFQVE